MWETAMGGSAICVCVVSAHRMEFMGSGNRTHRVPQWVGCMINQLTEPPGGANTSHRVIHNITCRCVACGTLVATSRHTRYTGAKQIMYFRSLSVTTTVLPT